MTPSLSSLWGSWIKRPRGRPALFLALVLGALYPLGLAPLAWWPLLFLSVFGLVWILLHIERPSYWKVTYCYGLGFFAVGASWVHVSIHQFGNAPLWLSIGLTAVFVLFLALFKALIGGLLALLSRYLRSPMFVFPLLWLLIDYLQGAFLTGFPWLYIGYGLIDTPFSHWLSFIGVFGGSFLWVAVVTALAMTLHYSYRRQESGKAKRPLIYGLVGIVSVTAIFSTITSLLSNKPLRSQQVSIGVVQPNIPQVEKWNPEKLPEYLYLYDEMTKPLWEADFIFWPEAAIPALQHRVKNWLEHWDKQAKSSQTELILGIPRYDFEQQRVYASLISLGSTSQVYDKHHLVPFGEFVPFEGVLRGLIEFFNLPMSRMAPGPEEQGSFSYQKINLLPAICYEIAYLDRFLLANKNDENQRVNVILTVSNDAWFGRSWGPHQHYQIARARALELAMPLIRATNNGISAVVDANGQTVKQLPQYEKSSFVQTFELTENRSVFFNHRYLVIILLVGFAQLLLFGYERILNKNT